MYLPEGHLITQPEDSPLTSPDSDAVKDNPMKLWSSSWTVSEAPLYVEAGDLCLTITRLAHEWQLHYHWIKRGENGNLAARYLEASSEPQLPPDRVVMESMPSEITLVPKLADRPIVVRPRSPFIIPANIPSRFLSARHCGCASASPMR